MSQSKSLYVNGDVVCTDVREATSIFKKAIGRMFTPAMPIERALTFIFDESSPVAIHMLFVFYSLGVVWVRDGQVVEVRRLPPWIGYHREKADTVIEIHPDKLDQIEVGDTIELK